MMSSDHDVIWFENSGSFPWSYFENAMSPTHDTFGIVFGPQDSVISSYPFVPGLVLSLPSLPTYRSDFVPQKQTVDEIVLAIIRPYFSFRPIGPMWNIY